MMPSKGDRIVDFETDPGAGKSRSLANSARAGGVVLGEDRAGARGTAEHRPQALAGDIVVGLASFELLARNQSVLAHSVCAVEVLPGPREIGFGSREFRFRGINRGIRGL